MAAYGSFVAPPGCWRCGAALYPGYSVCLYCGLDLSATWRRPVERRQSRPLLVLGAIAAIIVLAAVGAFVASNGSNGSDVWDPGIEPSPSSAWYSFTSPEGSWSVMFPNSSSPMNLSQPVDLASGTLKVNMYMTLDGDSVYEAAWVDLPIGPMGAANTSSFLDGFEKGMVTDSGGEITGSRSLTFKTYDAREVKFSGATGMKLDGYARFWIVGERVYVLMVMGEPGTTMYPEHFFDSFNMSAGSSARGAEGSPSQVR